MTRSCDLRAWEISSGSRHNRRDPTMTSKATSVFDDSARMVTLSSYVPQAVLQRIAPMSTLPDEPLLDEAPTALLFVDISGFTGLTEAAVRAGPAGTERLSRALN